MSSCESLRMSRTISTTAARLSMVMRITTARVIRRRTPDRVDRGADPTGRMQGEGRLPPPGRESSETARDDWGARTAAQWTPARQARSASAVPHGPGTAPGEDAAVWIRSRPLTDPPSHRIDRRSHRHCAPAYDPPLPPVRRHEPVTRGHPAAFPQSEPGPRVTVGRSGDTRVGQLDVHDHLRQPPIGGLRWHRPVATVVP